MFYRLKPKVIHFIFEFLFFCFGITWFQEAAQRVGEALVQACNDLNIKEISSYDRNGLHRHEEKLKAFEVAISSYGFLPR